MPKKKKTLSPIRKSAKGEECQIRIPGVCNFNPETVVLCHLGGAGIGIKSLDIFSAYGCNDCHDVVDQRVLSEFSMPVIKMMFFEAMVRTQVILIGKGLVVIK